MAPDGLESAAVCATRRVEQASMLKRGGTVAVKPAVDLRQRRPRHSFPGKPLIRLTEAPLLKSRTVRGSITNRYLRAVTTCCVLLAQVHLLWVAVLHRHEAVTVPVGATTVREVARHPQPAVESGVLCTACQIVRQSAARPAAGTPTPEPAAAVSLRPVVPSNEFYSYERTVVYGRAPPAS